MSRTRTDQYSETTIVRTRGRFLARAFAVLLAVAIVAELFHVALARDLAGSEAPDFALKSIAGKNLRLSEYRSEVVAVAFWASWCGDCRSGLPVLEKMQQQMGTDGLRVLSVSFDKDTVAARDVAAAAHVSFPVLLDPAGEVGRLYDVGNLPLVVLVDRGGRIRGSYEGGRSVTEQALAKDIRTLLRE
jgi:peroxiredoxin